MDEEMLDWAKDMFGDEFSDKESMARLESEILRDIKEDY